MFQPFSLIHAPREVVVMLLSIVCVLLIFSLFFYFLSRSKKAKNFSGVLTKIKSWWMMVAIIYFFLLNRELTFIGFALLSFISLRELLLQLKRRPSDRFSVILAFCFIPLQYLAIYLGYRELSLILIPGFLFLILPFVTMLSGNTKGLIFANATLLWSVMICVYGISHFAMLLSLPAIKNFSAGNLGLLLFLLFVTQFNDVLQFCFGKALGKKKIIPQISPNKTWEGFLGGFFSSIIVAYLFSFLTFFSWWQAMLMGAILSFSGFAGDLNISAIKRDLEVKDLGTTIDGHGGILDRIDSLTYTAIIFYHLVNFWR